jgi:hypothetical protein
MIFPIYRSLANHLVLYQINSENEFIELKITGNYYSINSYHASQYPEKLKIREMILNSDKSLIEIDQIEFNRIKFKCEHEKKLIAF